MKRRRILQGGAIATGIAIGGVSPVSAQACKLEGRDNLDYDGDGEQIIDLNRYIYNSIDTGHCDPTAWAEIEYKQGLEVYDEGDQFVLIVTYNGGFDAYGDNVQHTDDTDGNGVDDSVTHATHQTPNDCSKTLDGNESGPFQGGLRYSFEGDFNPDDSPTGGNLGAFDHGCDGTLTCDGDIEGSSFTGWMDDYFDNLDDFDLKWWGFIYHGGRHGTWVNSSRGDCGNID